MKLGIHVHPKCYGEMYLSAELTERDLHLLLAGNSVEDRLYIETGVPIRIDLKLKKKERVDNA